MVQLLDQSLSEGGVDQLARPAQAAPPKEMPDVERFVEPRWPRRAKILTAVLGVLAIAGLLGTAVQYFNDDTASVDQAQVVDITEQRNALLVQNGNLRADVAGLEADNAQVQATNTGLQATNSQLQADNAQLQAQSDAVSADLATTQADMSTISKDLAVTTAQVDNLTNQVSDLQATNEAVTAQRDALAAMFPMLLDTSLVGVDVAGTYTVKWFPAYNSGLPDNALLRAARVVISETPEGWLQLTIPGVLTAGLLATDGALSTVVDTTTAVPPVDGVTRIARVVVTIYAGAALTAEDGTTSVTELDMSVAITTPAVGDFPTGVSLYGSALTPQA